MGAASGHRHRVPAHLPGPGNPARYPPITYAAYLDWWYDANYHAARQRDGA